MKTLAYLFMATVPVAAPAAQASFADDVAFIRQHQEPVVLSSPDGRAQVLVAPGYQGRVLTSTAGGDAGFSFGWINRELIASGEVRRHINVYGGEDRMWLGPEGGPYALFFQPGEKQQTLDRWQTPALIDTAAWKVTAKSASEVRLAAEDRLPNRAGTVLTVKVERSVRLLDRAAASRVLDAELPPSLSFVGFETDNLLRNGGAEAWSRERGLPSVWILGMFQSGPRTTIVLPYAGDSRESPVRSDYFGPIGPDRLLVGPRAAYYSGDARSRGKIGIPPGRARPLAGSWDAARGVLTLIQFDLPADAAHRPYVDSRWIDMPHPYAGDAVNAYNDGPPAPGQPQLGPFYELESSSPAAELKPGESIRHRHATFHFQGDRAELDRLSRVTLGVSLEEIEGAFGR